MELEVDDGCTKDYVQVLDGIDENAPLVGKFCGSTSPSPITSQGMSLYVQFVSDAVGQEAGFRAAYTKAVSGILIPYLLYLAHKLQLVHPVVF